MHASAFTKTASVVISSFLSTDDSLNYQSSSEIERRIFPSTYKASQRTEETTVDPEGNGVAGQKCSLLIKIVNII